MDKLYEAIDKDAAVLETVDAEPFVHTPLHIAASEGHLCFAIEMMRLKPSFALKLNKQGYSPIHVALHKNHHNLVRLLVNINKDLVQVKGRERNTPLHYVCQSDSEENIELLVDLLEACPDSINDVNIKNETALHIALKDGYLTAFCVMVGWLNRNTRSGAALLEESTSNRKDKDGNTILHISALHDNIQAIDLLIKSMQKCINMRNLEGKTALDLADGFPEIQITLLKAEAKQGASIPDLNLEKKPRLNRTFPERAVTLIGRMEERSVYMVIAALIITAIYQTVLSPPGGLHHVNDTSSSSRNFVHPDLAGGVFGIIALANTAIFMWTFTTVLVITPGGRINHFLSLPIYLFTFTYLFSLLIMSQ